MSTNACDLEAVRRFEFSELKTLLPEPPCRVLEVGGHDGLQASLLAALGYGVVSVDTAPAAKQAQHFPVIKYDGTKLPFPAQSFELIFSSNVLEHVAHFSKLQSEFARVLAPRGLGLHVLPSSTWRLWTSITHPVRIIRGGLGILRRRMSPPSEAGTNSRTWRWRHLLFPDRHGEKGNAITELYWFSEFAWRRRFRQSGWSTLQVLEMPLFYTGQLSLGRWLNTKHRQMLARVLGGASKIYRVKPS